MTRTTLFRFLGCSSILFASMFLLACKAREPFPSLPSGYKVFCSTDSKSYYWFVFSFDARYGLEKAESTSKLSFIAANNDRLNIEFFAPTPKENFEIIASMLNEAPKVYEGATNSRFMVSVQANSNDAISQLNKRKGVSYGLLVWQSPTASALITLDSTNPDLDAVQKSL